MTVAGGNPDLPHGGSVAFFGLFGSWTHMAARRVFGASADYLENPTISRVFEAVATNAAAFGVVPIENSTEGGVNQTVDELIESDLHIRGEVVLEIAQCLMGRARDLSTIAAQWSASSCSLRTMYSARSKGMRSRMMPGKLLCRTPAHAW